MIEAISIPKDLPRESALNYDFLRAEGIKHIQQLAGHIWTDHNTHDPGITILEQLCYAITDLSYRIDNNIKDLLGTDGSTSYGDLQGPAKMLTMNPVTLLDIRKAVIDITGVKNAWVEKVSETQPMPFSLATAEDAAPIQLKGLYRVVFEKDESSGVDSGLLGKVKAKLQSCRGICEDFEEVKLLDPQFIRLHGTIEVGQVENINEFVADVLLRAAAHISPPVPFYSLQAMLEKGKKIDEIFDGPALEHGFIENSDLLDTPRKTEIHTSDLIRAIMDHDQVLAVNQMGMSTGSAPMKNWALPLDMAKTPKLDVRGTLESLHFAKQGLKASVDLDRVNQLYLEKRDALQFEVLATEERDIVLAETQDRKLETYYSIQNQFPTNYGIGTFGLPDAAPVVRKAQAKQLKSYLLFFEQLLANYFSQTAHFKDLLGFDGEDRRTYFNQSLLGTIPGLEEVLVSEESYASYLEEMTGDSVAGLERKNMFMNHLLARFSEAFTDYGMLLHNPGATTEHAAAQKLITDKSNFLKDYPALSAGRAKGFNYSEGVEAEDNISGLKKRIARKLGIEDVSHKRLGDGDSEGFHFVEHILLRPTANSTPQIILAFETAERTGWTKCIVGNHQLQAGEEIRIQGSEGYDGFHTVDQTSKDSFEIEVAFVPTSGQNGGGSSEEKMPKWERAKVDIRHLVLTDAIEAISASTRPGHTRCEVAGHGLKPGTKIEIVGTKDYNGTFEVSEVTENSFEIEQAFVAAETGGRWMPTTGLGDLYSLQVTYVFPDWAERYRDGNFKVFVENMIREETPAHLSIYVQWLQKPEMQRFDQAYNEFLSALSQR